MRRLPVVAAGAAVVALVGGAAGAQTTRVVGNDAPDWSPNGSRIAFTAFREGRGEIATMNADGSGVRLLTQSRAHDDVAAWSPDGGRIAFVSDRDGNLEIYVMNADGSNQTRLTQNNAPDLLPTWSPDGTRIAFRSDREGSPEIYAMNADGSGQVNLTRSPGADTEPDWGPDGRIAFASYRSTVGWSIFVMDATGGGQRRVTQTPAFQSEHRPTWSPTGTQLLFMADRDPPVGNREIYVVAADGTDVRRVTNDPGWDDWPTWAPDGRRIAFSRGPSLLRPEIHVSNLDGSGVAQLTSTVPSIRVASIDVLPTRPVAGRRFAARALVVEETGDAVTSGVVTCRGTVGSRPAPVALRRFRNSLADCAWLIPRGTKGKMFRGTITVRSGTRTVTEIFALRVA